MAGAGPGTVLFGRQTQLRHLDDLVRHAAERGGALVLRGEAGIGKSALLRAARGIARDSGMLVLSTSGVEAESVLPFAGLHTLLRPLLARAEDLPGPQREALLAAFGMAEAATSDLFLIALAALNMLVDAAADTAALLIVEDAHWLDPASAEVLAFVARRLESDPVVLLAAVRDGFDSSLAAGLAELRLERLDPTAAAAVLDARAADLPPDVRSRLLAEADGNPLALVELPTAARLTDHDILPPADRPLTIRLEEAFAARVSGLPDSTATLLVVAALNDGDAISEALDAATVITGTAVTVDDLTPALAAQLVTVDGQAVRFRHPLMRSAIQQRAGIAQRHAAHSALARVLTRDPDRRVWHRAASSHGPDESIAAELEEAAALARRKGAVVTAVAALERSAVLSGDPDRRAARLLLAAEAAVELGRHDVVVRLVRQADALPLSSRQRAQLLWIGASFDGGLRDESRKPGALADVAERVAADGHTSVALRLLNLAALRCFWTHDDPAARHRIVGVAESLPVGPDDPDLLAILAFAAPIERGTAVIDGLRRGAARAAGDPEALRLVGSAAVLVGAFDLAARCCGESIGELRAQGRLGLLVRALGAQAWSAAHLADLGVGIPAAEESSRLARETSQPLFLAIGQATGAVLAALRGHEDHARDLAAEAERAALSGGIRPVLATAQLARGLAALGAGRYLDAYEHLRRMHDPADPSFHPALRCFALAELADAAVHCGRRAAITELVAQLEVLGGMTPAPALHAGLRYARAVLADDADAEALYQAALLAESVQWPFTRARTQLAYGEWLRRQRRIAECRAPLRAARDTFDTLGTIPWGERARQELRASGEASHRRSDEVSDRLTAQELQIAQMAAEGLTNREIGQRLYLSHRTVSSHLHRIFPKLEITSRSQLGSLIRRPQATTVT
ncbi:DNA-binding CsgD family transcriptional regulator [Allocatelliglobosispora scoriae]|uniref:DNA-binding CsgD family transcriptional regulator n=1 Tax=Allocatelliglobosispora scoriae TaxID=643052 RepID=A0A841BEQ7_9ACTN|nr:LuxR family transcriptional regulator [Allocatelliglobosispora scoriae]MBB5867567.1 DNA-binding CsgD family transcriptional regulator [Allocatelliglobosispora scoriae]